LAATANHSEVVDLAMTNRLYSLEGWVACESTVDPAFQYKLLNNKAADAKKAGTNQNKFSFFLPRLDFINNRLSNNISNEILTQNLIKKCEKRLIFIKNNSFV
jgi:hypothetical protein